ncbi:MAG: glycosyltransferase family 2 protein [Ignavibacteriaceae bacterium]|nr:glycosyltransferase family 2 protein [Ignavibacteriaceae bacterium]
MLVSVVVPCRNEVKYISRSIESICNQIGFDKNIEVIVVDGMSEDGTREILSDKLKKFTNLTVINNPQRITPVARNIGIKNSSGKFICIMDAHSVYDLNYLQTCLDLLNIHQEVSCVGGPITSVGENDFGRATAIAMSSIIGVGNAKHRFPKYEGYAEMACFPMFRREVFDKIGYYDESLIRNQDDEFSLRLRLSGSKVFISPNVKSLYYVRNSPQKLFKQYFNYGFWRWMVIKKHKIQISYRQIIPPAFIILLLIFTILGLVLKSLPLIFIIPCIYLLVIGAYSLRLLKKESLRIAILFSFSIVILHFSYGIGVLYSYLKDKFNLYWK